MSAPGTFTTGPDNELGFDLTVTTDDAGHLRIVAAGPCWQLNALLHPQPVATLLPGGGT